MLLAEVRLTPTKPLRWEWGLKQFSSKSMFCFYVFSWTLMPSIGSPMLKERQASKQHAVANLKNILGS